MNLALLLASLLQVSSLVVSRPPIEVSGYVGDNVTLPSGADPSWKLSRIEWSIFSNNTWIATYFSDKTNTERVSDYENRLSLNPTTGNLTIKNLQIKDARDYTVDLSNITHGNAVNKIRLTVKQRLQTPIIEKIHSGTKDGGCFMMMNCFSPDEGVDFSWHVNPPTLFAWNNPKSGLSQLIVNSNTTEDFHFTCITSRHMENASQVFKSKCAKADGNENPPPRHRCVLVFIAGVLFGLIPSCCFCCAEHFKAAWQSLEGRLRV